MTERKLKLVKTQKDHTRQTRQAGRNQNHSAKHSAKHSAEPILSLSKASVHSPSEAETEGKETEKSQTEENQIQNLKPVLSEAEVSKIQNPRPVTPTSLRVGTLKFEDSVHNLSAVERGAPEGNAVERSEAEGNATEGNQIQNPKPETCTEQDRSIQNPTRVARQVMLRRIMAELMELDSIPPAA